MASKADYFVEVLKIRLQDPRYIILATCFVVGFLSIFAGARDSNWVIIGPVAGWIDDHILLPFIGRFFQLVIGVLAGTFFLQFLMALASGEARLFNVWGWLSTFFLVLAIIWAIAEMPSFFSTGEPGSIFSVIPGIGNFVGGP